jgi:fatty-acyl-CoA synthase
MATHVRTLVEALQRVADRHTSGYSYVTEDGTVRFESFHELYRRASCIGMALQAYGLTKGDRLGMILYNAQEFIDSFFGALLVGVIPVPMAPPPARFGQSVLSLRHVAAIVARAQPRLLLTDAHVQPLLEPLQDSVSPCAVRTLDLLLHDIEPHQACPAVAIAADDTAFLQFTSGSTSQPRGVRLSHANLVANVRGIARYGLQSTPDDYCVSWLPLYHDMGLIGKVLVPLYAGMRGVLFIPTGLFLKRPLSWLYYISSQQGTITFAPNFAYNLCLTRAGTRAFEGLDLSSLRIAGCGAEPIRYDVLTAFTHTFQPYGLRPEALMPCYGLAEHTLAVSFSPIHTGVIVDRVWTAALARGEAIPVEASASQHDVAHVVSCGRVFPGHVSKIVDADGHALPERMVGEILLRGPSVSQGYFEDAEATATTWRDGWLHTGDLGYLADGNLYVCGRIKDLIIVHGRNYHPQDLEWQAAHIQGVRSGNVIAFGCEDSELGRERVVIVAETRLPEEQHRHLQQAIKTRLLEALSLTVDEVLLVPPHTLPKTSSGKLQRTRTRELFRSGELGLR